LSQSFILACVWFSSCLTRCLYRVRKKISLGSALSSSHDLGQTTGCSRRGVRRLRLVAQVRAKSPGGRLAQVLFPSVLVPQSARPGIDL
jgi:hypothetical protein